MRDLASNIDLKRGLSPVAATTDNTAYVSTVLDRKDYDSAVFAALIGANTDVDATFVVLIEESDLPGSGFTAVADADLNGTEILAGFQFDDDNELRKIGYVGNKRYVRATITPANNAAGNIFLAGVWILGNAAQKPTASVPA
jgi:hypothetical protein